MRLLVLDHFFGQDIAALRAAGGEWRELPYHRLRWEALRIFPPEVATGLEAYASSAMAERRAVWAARLRELLFEEFMRFPFDAFVVPSDVFFYVRDAPEACHALGAPFFVAQKETTIAEHTMREHAQRVARYAPPRHDHMTVCSERHKRFWTRAGAAPETITVTGQPRFDVYADPSRWQAPGGRPPTALFFSYHVDAYHPDEGADAPVWRQLHEETERGLADLAGDGWRVLVKPHPQQPPPRLRRGLRLVPGKADARELIRDADVVVGFQTTALLEAMLAGKPVLYTGWDAEAQRLGADLIPFADWAGAIDVLRSPGELAAVARERLRRPVAPESMAARRSAVEEFLGPVDGRASERTLAVLERVVARFAAERAPEQERLRADLARRRPPLALGRRARRKLDTARAMARTLVSR